MIVLYIFSYISELNIYNKKECITVNKYLFKYI